MDTVREIEEIKARLERIETFLSAANEGAQDAHAETAYELLDFHVRRAMSIIGPGYAYKLTVKNSSNVDLRFTGSVIFLDSSQFVVDRDPISNFTVPAGETHIQAGKATIVDENHALRIADVTAEIWPI